MIKPRQQIVGLSAVFTDLELKLARIDLLAWYVGILTYRMTVLEEVPLPTLLWSCRTESLRNDVSYVLTVEGVR